MVDGVILYSCIISIMSAPLWLQFTGTQTKRKRAELACVACHSKKVSSLALHGLGKDANGCRLDVTCRREGLRGIGTVPSANLAAKNAGE